MKIEIWSDLACPFCYIGKKRFEMALKQYAGKDSVEVEWKSYQLNPGLVTQPDKNHDAFLAEQKGISIEQARAMSSNAARMAEQTGLTYHFDKAIPANTFKAHQMLHHAKTAGLQNEVKESLFNAYFTEGKNIDDMEVLIELGREAGLDAASIKEALETDRYADHVSTDIYEARQVGVRGVPFFLFNRKYVISGAQDSNVFLSALNQIGAEEGNNN